ncbi:MAG TPA: plastocyanin/azurin family copper-binding protein [Frankiaceae bacterium]|jgi:plastocyanin|nr:plastocyanin/azurin family copper-binding protein [Frankiaceae bacterium]
MNARRLTLLAACALAAPAAPAGALPAPVPHQVVTVGAVFASPEITIFRGDTLTLTNLDAALTHDLVSRDYVPGTGVRRFASSPVTAGGRSDVARVSSLGNGVYPFLCSLHEGMTGNLRVQTAPAR